MPKKISEEEKLYLTEFGKHIRILREATGWTQADLVYEAGVHGNLVGRIERGERAANILQLKKIAIALDVNVVDLFK